MSVPRSRRFDQIVDLLGQAGEKGITRKEAATSLNVKYSPYITGLLDEVVEQGLAVKRMDDSVYPPTWRYYTTERTDDKDQS